MEPISSLESAQIFAFPAAQRRAEVEKREEAALQALGAAKAEIGSGWYHEAAMHDDESASKAQELPWWAEAEDESLAKGKVRILY